MLQKLKSWKDVESIPFDSLKKNNRRENVGLSCWVRHILYAQHNRVEPSKSQKYARVSAQVNGKSFSCYLHVLVWLYFNKDKEIPDGYCIRHISKKEGPNGTLIDDHGDNRIENLECCKYSDNVEDCLRNEKRASVRKACSTQEWKDKHNKGCLTFKSNPHPERDAALSKAVRKRSKFFQLKDEILTALKEGESKSSIVKKFNLSSISHLNRFLRSISYEENYIPFNKR